MSAFSNRKSGQSARMDFLPPEQAGRRGAQRPRASADIIEAEFEVLRGSGDSRFVPVFNDNRARRAPSSRSASHVVLKLVAKVVRQIEAGLHRLSARAFAGLVLAVALGAASLTASIALRPQGISSPIDSFQPFQISDVETVLRAANGMGFVEVTGSVSNLTGSLQALPAIELDTVGNGAMRRVALIASDGRPIGPGQSARFTARFPHAGGKLPGLKFSFAGLDASAL